MEDQFQQILISLLSTDNEVRTQAEVSYKVFYYLKFLKKVQMRWIEVCKKFYLIKSLGPRVLARNMQRFFIN